MKQYYRTTHSNKENLKSFSAHYFPQILWKSVKELELSMWKHPEYLKKLFVEPSLQGNNSDFFPPWMAPFVKGNEVEWVEIKGDQIPQKNWLLKIIRGCKKPWHLLIAKYPSSSPHSITELTDFFTLPIPSPSSIGIVVQE